MDLDQLPLIRYIQLHRFILSQQEDYVKINFRCPPTHSDMM